MQGTDTSSPPATRRRALAFVAALLSMATSVLAQCPRYEYPNRVHGEVSIELQLLGLRFSNERNEFFIDYRVDATQLGDRKIQVQANINVQLTNASINRCVSLGQVEGAGTYSTRVTLPLSGTSSSPGRYLVHMEIGLTGDTSDSPDNNIDSIEVEHGPRLSLSDPRLPGDRASVLVKNTGRNATGEISIQTFHNQNGRFISSRSTTWESLDPGAERRCEFDSDPSILYDLRFFDANGVLLAHTLLEGETYSDNGTIDTGSPDFPPPPGGTIIPTAPNDSLVGGGVALGSNDPKITVRVNRRRPRFRRPRYYVHTDVELGQAQEPAVLHRAITKYGRDLGFAPLTVTEDGTYGVGRITISNGRPEGTVELVLDESTKDLNTDNNKWILNQTEAEAPPQPGEAPIQFTPIRGDVIFRSPEANADAYPVNVVIKVHAQGVPAQPYEFEWSVDEDHLADLGFREITQVNTDPLANGDLQLEFSALLDPDSAFGRGARTPEETTASFPLRLRFRYEAVGDGERGERTYDETIPIVVEAKTILPAYDIVPQLLVVTTPGEEPVDFPTGSGEVQDIQEGNTIFFRVQNIGNVPVPEGTTFRAELKWARGNQGDTWAEAGTVFEVEHTTQKEIISGDIEEIHVHYPGRWICDHADPPRPQNDSMLIAEFYETDFLGGVVPNGTAGVPADITEGTNNYQFRRVHYRPVCTP